MRIWKLMLTLHDPDDPEHREIVLQCSLTDHDVRRIQLEHELHHVLDEAIDQVLRADRLIQVGEE